MRAIKACAKIRDKDTKNNNQIGVKVEEKEMKEELKKLALNHSIEEGMELRKFCVEKAVQLSTAGNEEFIIISRAIEKYVIYGEIKF
jgi:hypothetical protein